MILQLDGKGGGVGKTTIAAAFAEALAARKLGFTVIECDASNNVASYCKGIPNVKIEKIALLRKDGYLDLASALASKDIGEHVLVSVPGGADTAGNAAVLIDALNQAKRPMAICWMLNRAPEQVATLRRMLDVFAKSPIKLAAVRNLVFGEPDKFTRWNEGEARPAFLKAFPGMEFDFPELSDKVVDATIGAVPTKVRFSDAGEKLAESGYRWAAARWLEQTAALYAAIEAKVAGPIAVEA